MPEVIPTFSVTREALIDAAKWFQVLNAATSRKGLSQDVRKKVLKPLKSNLTATVIGQVELARVHRKEKIKMDAESIKELGDFVMEKIALSNRSCDDYVLPPKENEYNGSKSIVVAIASDTLEKRSVAIQAVKEFHGIDIWRFGGVWDTHEYAAGIVVARAKSDAELAVVDSLPDIISRKVEGHSIPPVAAFGKADITYYDIV